MKMLYKKSNRLASQNGLQQFVPKSPFEGGGIGTFCTVALKGKKKPGSYPRESKKPLFFYFIDTLFLLSYFSFG
jgi:hypothetical protein